MIIKNIRVVNPKTHWDAITDITIKDGLIASLEPTDAPGDLDGTGLIAAPGFIDTHVHFRDPGQTHKEDIASGSSAALAGGYTSVVTMANTRPILDNVEVVEDYLTRAKAMPIHIYTVAALTKGFKSESLTDMDALKQLGVVGFSDDGIPNTKTALIYDGLKKAKALDVPVSFHEEDPTLNRENGVNAGDVAASLGLCGAPGVAEDVLVARDGVLCCHTGAKVVIQHISSKGAVDLVRYFKSRGASIYAEATPHHFSSTEDLVLSQGTLAKMNPPLRTEADRCAIVEGLADGTIDCIATDHAPHAAEEKAQDFVKAPSGIIGLETALSLGLVHLVDTGALSLMEFLRKLTSNPAALYQLRAGSLEVGMPADITIFDMLPRTVGESHSKSDNTPYQGVELKGNVRYTFVDGEIKFQGK
ncbi:dihydroorotase [Peptoniphilus equinus]|uniref:Dihydroorotase n=1 Tax=Peptoniphilus equinus TaxID=3016343 RepID=A0ABY7QSW1_9FIRM|nr:dihydroorotase [Peptoniphilus equinus]WBW49880.1 dihydroorotase [Peptoniphilus equinus]